MSEAWRTNEPAWWNHRRYGLFVHASLATVPAWAPLGQYAEWYRSHLGDDVPDVLLHPHPLVEVVQHHQDRWDHIQHYDDFVELLTFERFDAEEWARLAVDGGMGYTVFVAKHHDGWCWWDAPNTERTTVLKGPRRNVVAEYAAACERNDVVFGTYYSLLDWADERYPDDDYVEQVLHPHVTDLATRYGSRVLWGDGHWGHDGARWRSDELLDRLCADIDVIANDRWRSDLPGIRTFEYDPPEDITPGPWELCRGVGASFGHNRNERAAQHLDAHAIVALLTEVIAKGGHLLLNVGPASDGTIPELQRQPILAAGTWVRRHRDLVDRGEPWTVWGDDDARYVTVDDVLYAIDVSGRGRFAALSPDRVNVATVERVGDDVAPTINFVHDDDGLHLDLPRSRPWRRAGFGAQGDPTVDPQIDVAVYRIEVAPVDAPVALFDTSSGIGQRTPIQLAPLLVGRRPGEIVQLGSGPYRGPAEVPDGVVLRGLGATRTHIEGDGSDGPTLSLGERARVEHVAIHGPATDQWWVSPPAVDIAGSFATMLGCTVDGSVTVSADDGMIRATSVSTVRSSGAHRITLSRCTLRGNRWNVGIHLTGGSDHDIDSCQVTNHLCGIRLTDVVGCHVRGNHIEGRWWGVHLQRSTSSHVHGNQTRWTMRAVDVDGGTDALIDGNAVADGDSGCVVQGGAVGCQVVGNHWERCRIGLLDWESVGLQSHANSEVDPLV